MGRHGALVLLISATLSLMPELGLARPFSSLVEMVDEFILGKHTQKLQNSSMRPTRLLSPPRHRSHSAAAFSGPGATASEEARPSVAAPSRPRLSVPEDETGPAAVAEHLRSMLVGAGMEPLTPEAREALGSPCSAKWQDKVLRWSISSPNITAIRGGDTDTSRRSIQAVCNRVNRGLASLSKNPGPCSKRSKPCKWDSRLARLVQGRQGVTLPQAPWGSCWPDHVPISPGLQLEQLLHGKFLVAGFLLEQLSKAKMHLAEMAQLALDTGRILVLPTASSSRLMMGRPQGVPQDEEHEPIPMCRYLSVERLKDKFIQVTGKTRALEVPLGVPWISSDVLSFLLAAFLPTRPRVKLVCLDRHPKLKPTCLEQPEVLGAMESLLVATFGAYPEGDHFEQFILPCCNTTLKEKVARALTEALEVDESERSSADIVVLVKTSPHMLLQGKVAPEEMADALFPLPPHLTRRAGSIAKSLGSDFVALHFRSEYIVWSQARKDPEEIPAVMHACAVAAATLARNISESKGGLKVLLLADVASDAGTPRHRQWRDRSSSWGEQVLKYGARVTLEPAKRAVKFLHENVPTNVVLDNLDHFLPSMESGEMAIMDKILASHAGVFLAGSAKCGGTHSFEGGIRRLRKSLGKEEVLRWPDPETPELSDAEKTKTIR